MDWQLKMCIRLACIAILPCAAAAQAPSPVAPAATAPAPNTPTGTPEGLTRMQNANSTGFPAPNMVEGQPIETRPPELEGDHALFPGQTRAPYRATAPYKTVLITDQLKTPWCIAFLPDGKMLVTEKNSGALVLVDGGGAISAPIANVPASVYQGQVGLLDVALDAKYASNKRLFLSYSESAPVPGNGAAEDTRIVIASAKFDEAGLSLSDVKVIFRANPALPRRLSANQGGRIAVARDGTLFMTVGDRSSSPPWDMAQRLDTDLGKMIHITPDGAPARNNPFLNKVGALPEIWSIGHRSEEGLTFDNAGRLWEVEDGPRGGDKLLHPEAGKNYGWPLYAHALDYPGEKINGGAIEAPGTEQPVYFWDPVIAPSGMAFYKGRLFPQWKNSLFVGALRGLMLDRLEIKAGKVVAEEPLLVEQKTRIRDVRIGADGAVYVITDYGKLMKLTPQ